MTRILAMGVAHLSFPGGGVFLPARSPYDRQLLAEHLFHHVHAVSQVQVLLNEQRWLISVPRDPEAQRCSMCGSLSDVVCHLPGVTDSSFCASCAFSDMVKPLTLVSLSAHAVAAR